MLFESELPPASLEDLNEMYAQAEFLLNEASTIPMVDPILNKVGRFALKWVIAYGTPKTSPYDLRH